MVDVAEFHRHFIDSAPDGLLYVDREGTIVFWNAGCERIFGFSQDEAVGKSLDIVIPDSQRSRHWEGFAKTIETGRSRYGAGDVLAVPALRKDQTRVSVEFSIVPFVDEAGTMIGMGAIMRDVTQRFEQTKAMKIELARLRKSVGDLDAPS